MTLSRREFAALAAAAPLLAQKKKIPVGLEMYSVRGELMKDIPSTVRAVAKMGYEVVEFYAPYFMWTTDQAKQVRQLMDDLGIRCNSTHNNTPSFTAEGLPRAIELNQILGSKCVVMGDPGNRRGIDWKVLADKLTQVSEKLRPMGMSAGYHNHQYEWPLVNGKRPMDILAANTPKELMLQLDVGTCVQMKVDPVEWIRANPGRIRCIHCKDWAAGTGPEKGYRALFGEGDSPWAKIFEAAESVGGIEYYLIEQEGSRYPELETAERCLATWKKLKM